MNPTTEGTAIRFLPLCQDEFGAYCHPVEPFLSVVCGIAAGIGPPSRCLCLGDFASLDGHFPVETGPPGADESFCRLPTENIDRRKHGSGADRSGCGRVLSRLHDFLEAYIFKVAQELAKAIGVTSISGGTGNYLDHVEAQIVGGDVEGAVLSTFPIAVGCAQEAVAFHARMRDQQRSQRGVCGGFRDGVYGDTLVCRKFGAQG